MPSLITTEEAALLGNLSVDSVQFKTLSGNSAIPDIGTFLTNSGNIYSMLVMSVFMFQMLRQIEPGFQK